MDIEFKLPPKRLLKLAIAGVLIGLLASVAMREYLIYTHTQIVTYVNENGTLVKHVSFLPVKRGWWGQPDFD